MPYLKNKIYYVIGDDGITDLDVIMNRISPNSKTLMQNASLIVTDKGRILKDRGGHELNTIDISPPLPPLPPPYLPKYRSLDDE